MFKGVPVRCLTAVLCALLSMQMGCGPGLPRREEAVSEDNRTAEFWIKKVSDPDRIIMNEKEIAVFNQEIMKTLPQVIKDLAAYPEEVAGESILDVINEQQYPQKPLYYCGQQLGASFYDGLLQEMNLGGIKSVSKLRCAYTIRRTSIRSFPTRLLVTDDPGDLEFDLFQETALDPAEPVIVLHESVSGKWCFVQASFYKGWVPVADLAVATSREDWLLYLQADSFLVVTGSRLRLGYNPYSPEISELEFFMGARIPLAARDGIPRVVDKQSPSGSYVVKLPTRGRNGELAFKLTLVPRGSDVSVGYLPYTGASVIKQAFKMQGERYGWGGMFNSRDCTAFVRDIYRCFGFHFPRNSREQGSLPGRTVYLADADRKERERQLDGLRPGAVLLMPGHVMLYLGKHQGEYYVIHAIASCGERGKVNPDGSLVPVPLNGVVVTTLSLPRRSNGVELIMSLTSAKQIGS